MPKGLASKGVTLGFSATEGGSYTPVTGLVSVKAPKKKAKITERTALDDDVQEKGVAHIEIDQLTIEIRHDSDAIAALDALVGLRKWWKITNSKGDVWKGEAILAEGPGEEYKVGEDVVVNAMAEATGPWTYTKFVAP
ncbi:MAG: hypothetical protein U0744_02595 [Gemmataceae bacterium]